MVSTIRFLVMYNVEFFPFSDICSYNIGISTWFLDIEIYYKLGRWQSSGSPFSDIYFIPHNFLFYLFLIFWEGEFLEIFYLFMFKLYLSITNIQHMSWIKLKLSFLNGYFWFKDHSFITFMEEAFL